MSSPPPYAIEQHAPVRREVSQFSTFRVGIRIVDGDLPRDPSDNSTVLKVYRNVTEPDEDALVLSLSESNGIEWESTGVYSAVILSSLTQERGYLLMDWRYRADNVVQIFQELYEIIEPMPYYDALTDGEKSTVEQVNWMIGDLFDSSQGGPHLLEEYQSNFGYNRLAQLLTVTVNRVNLMGRPITKYKTGAEGGPGIPDNFEAVYMLGLYLEVVRHLIRSYTEQPLIQGGPGVAYTDRRDYAERWRAILKDEQDEFKHAVLQMKRKELHLGSGALIVSGGIFARNYMSRSGMYAAQTRAARFSPVSWTYVGLQH